MKRIIAGFILCLVMCVVQSQTVSNTASIRLNNGKFIKVEACTDEILRIRIASKNVFPESLMERYELINTKWNRTPLQEFDSTNQITLRTSKCSLIINKSTGTFSFIDINGRELVRNMQFNLTEDKPRFGGFIQSLNKVFEKEIISRDIIGGDTSSINAKNLLLKNKSALEKQEALLSPGRNTGIAEFSLNKTERFYGLGSATRDRIQQRGNAVRIWPQYQRSESPFPFIMSTDGWGVFFNTTRISYFDIGNYQPDKMMVLCSDESIDFYLMAGTMPSILNDYTTITKKPYLLPKWAYGLAFGSFWMEDELSVLNNAYHFRQENIPCDIYWLEYQWMEKNYDASATKDWNATRFFNAGRYFWENPNTPVKDIKPDLFVNRMNNMGFKVALWLNANQDLSVEEEDYLAVKNGKAPSGLEHWFPHLLKFVNQGVQGFKLDPSTTMDEHPDRKYYNGLPDNEMHSINQVMLPKQLYRTLKDSTGMRSFHHYCGGYAGIQHWAASTCGDNGGGHLALYDQLNLGISGVPNTSCDVLFLEKNEPIEQGLHFGFFLPWVQVNSWYGILHPWLLSPKQKKEFQFYAQLRYSLIPYIYSAAINSSLTGIPIVRAMPLMFPNDPLLENMTTQYMFGDNILVSVFSNKTYLPEGKWIDYWTGEIYNGNQEVVMKNQMHGGPLFIKSGAIIPFQKPMNYVDEHLADTIMLKIYPDKKTSFTLLEDDGKTFDYEKGNIARTVVECNESKEKTEIVIQPCKGTYTGILNARTWELEILFKAKPKQILINGAKTNNWKFNNEKKIKIIMSQKKISQKQVITIL